MTVAEGRIVPKFKRFYLLKEELEGAGAVEITPAMIEAGAKALGRNRIWLEGSSEEFDREVIKEILEASLIAQKRAREGAQG